MLKKSLPFFGLKVIDKQAMKRSSWKKTLTKSWGCHNCRVYSFHSLIYTVPKPSGPLVRIWKLLEDKIVEVHFCHWVCFNEIFKFLDRFLKDWSTFACFLGFEFETNRDLLFFNEFNHDFLIKCYKHVQVISFKIAYRTIHILLLQIASKLLITINIRMFAIVFLL